MVALKAEGLSDREIGERVGRPRSTVSAALPRARSAQEADHALGDPGHGGMVAGAGEQRRV